MDYEYEIDLGDFGKHLIDINIEPEYIRDYFSPIDLYTEDTLIDYINVSDKVPEDLFTEKQLVDWAIRNGWTNEDDPGV